MKKIISIILLVLLAAAFLAVLLRPFYQEVLKNGWRGFLVASTSYIIVFIILFLANKIVKWCLSVWE